MLLLGYLLGFAVVRFFAKRRGEQTRDLILVTYNYLFAVFLLATTSLTAEKATWQSVTEALLKGLYNSPPAITFRGNMSSASGLQQVAIFFIMSVYTLRMAISLFFRKALIRLRMLRRLHRAKDIYVVWGEAGDAAAMLAELHRRIERAAAVWIPFSDKADVPLPALTVTEAFLKKPDAGKNWHIVLLPDALNGNAGRLSRLDALGSIADDFHVTAFLDDDSLRLEDFRYSHLDAYLVSREELLIQDFFAEHRPLSILERRAPGTAREGVLFPPRPFSLCIAGFSTLSRAFLLSTYEHTAFETGSPEGRGLDARIFDGNDAEWACFLQDYPALSEEPAFRFSSADTADVAVCRHAEAHARELDEILLSTGDTSRNVAAARRLVRLFQRMGLSEAERPLLVVALHSDGDNAASLLAHEANVVFLRENRTQFTYDALIARAMDQRAEALHRRYCGSSLLQSEWKTLGTFTQNSNRAVVWDIPNKELLAKPMDVLHNGEKEAAFWQLARYEHRRWVAFHAARGWTTLPAEELTAEERSSFATKRISGRRHACMVAWDELDALPQREPGLLKWYDYENVRELFHEERCAE